MTKTGSDMAYGDRYDRRENLRLIFRNGKFLEMLEILDRERG